MVSGLDGDGAVASEGVDEVSDADSGACFEPAGDGQGCEDDGEVGVDGVSFVVVDGAGCEITFRHAE